MSLFKRLFASSSDTYADYGDGYIDRNGHGSYGHGSYGGHGSYDCCPLVVDPLTWIALLAFLAAGTYFLEVAVQMSMLGRRRKRSLSDYLLEGKHCQQTAEHQLFLNSNYRKPPSF